jgi:hypothetical protein
MKQVPHQGRLVHKGCRATASQEIMRKMKPVIRIKIVVMIPNQSFYSDGILIFLEISGRVAALQPLRASCRCVVSS